jgi:hypothetical protein
MVGVANGGCYMNFEIMGKIFKTILVFEGPYMWISLFVKLIEKLSVKKPTGEVKLKVMKAIAKEYQVEWDTTETEQELLKPPEERLVQCSSTIYWV